jgi:hypothetical protein
VNCTLKWLFSGTLIEKKPLRLNPLREQQLKWLFQKSHFMVQDRARVSGVQFTQLFSHERRTQINDLKKRAKPSTNEQFRTWPSHMRVAILQKNPWPKHTWCG